MRQRARRRRHPFSLGSPRAWRELYCPCRLVYLPSPYSASLPGREAGGTSPPRVVGRQDACSCVLCSDIVVQNRPHVIGHAPMGSPLKRSTSRDSL